MAERRSGSRPAVHFDYAFDRLFDAKLQNAYAILVPDRVHKLRQAHEVGDDHENCRPVRAGFRRAAERK